MTRDVSDSRPPIHRWIARAEHLPRARARESPTRRARERVRDFVERSCGRARARGRDRVMARAVLAPAVDRAVRIRARMCPARRVCASVRGARAGIASCGVSARVLGGGGARARGRGVVGGGDARGRVPAARAGGTSSYWSEEAMERETLSETMVVETVGRVGVARGGAEVEMSFGSEDEGDEDDGSAAGKRALGYAVVAAVVAAFAYSDVSATFPWLAPAQTLARSLVDMVAAGVDYLVDMLLDAYDAAILGCINVFAWVQTLLLTPGGVVASGTKTSQAILADPSNVVSKALGLLCAKPFMSIAAVMLTLSRVVASWTFAAAEYVCALLYAMPVYVAAPSATLIYLYMKRRSAVNASLSKVKSEKKLSKAKKQAASMLASGAATGASAKWAQRLASTGTSDSSVSPAAAAFASTMASRELAVSQYASSDFSTSSYSSDVSYASDASYSSSYSSSVDTPITAAPVNYDQFATASMSRIGGAYDFEESFSNREALMGGYDVDMAEVERLYAELMPKDAGIPVPVVEVKQQIEETVMATADSFTSSKSEATSVSVEVKEAKIEARKSEEAKVETAAEVVRAEFTKAAEVVEAEPAKAAEVVEAESGNAQVAKAESLKALEVAKTESGKKIFTEMNTKTVVTSSSSSSSTSTSSMKVAASSSSTKVGSTVKKGGSKEAFMGFMNQVTSIVPGDVIKAVAETAQTVVSKDNLEKAASLAKDAAGGLQSNIGKSSLPPGTRKVAPSDDETMGEGTMIKKKKDN